jgi:hypothetical protein
MFVPNLFAVRPRELKLRHHTFGFSPTLKEQNNDAIAAQD